MSKVKLILMSLLAVFIISAAASASASALTQHFDICEELSSSLFNGFSTLEKCTKSESPTGGKWTKYKRAAGSRFNVLMRLTAAFFLREILLGLESKITCLKGHGKGSRINPTGGGPGEGTETIELSECTVPEPTGQNCKVSEPIVTEVNTKLVEFTAKPADEFKPSGTNFMEFTLTGCSTAELNKTYPVKGADTGIVLNNTSELEFTNASTDLKVEGEAAKLQAKSIVLVEGSEAHLISLP